MNFITFLKSVINMRNKIKMERHEYTYGPHFSEDCAREAVANMRNEDGTTGAHWSIDEAAALANLYGVNLNGRFNKYDWFVALNMIRSDFYRVIVNLTNGDHVKHFVEFARAWLDDKDIEEGKMWKYYKYIMCNDDDEEEYRYTKTYRRPRYDYEDEHDYRYREPMYERRSRYY